MLPQRRPNRLFALLTAVITLISLTGLIAVYNASVIEAFNDFQDKYFFAKQQLIWLTSGFFVYFFVARLNPQAFKKLAFPILVVSLICMVLVLIPGLGLRLQGARRWLSLGFFRFQPSELLKVSLLIYLATWLEIPRGFKQFIYLVMACLGLIMLQPDLGTAVVVGSLSLGLFYLSGNRMREIVLFIAMLVVGGSFLVFTSPYRLQRLQTFLDPTSDTLGQSYHINQILIGLGSGGMSGVGLGRSRQKYAYLPEATTDSIFTIVGEELGFIGGSFLVILLVSVSLLALRIAAQARDRYSCLLASGIGLFFFAQICVNLSSIVALIPLTGVPLPLISYGGSSVITTFLALGILGSISRQK